MLGRQSHPTAPERRVESARELPRHPDRLSAARTRGMDRGPAGVRPISRHATGTCSSSSSAGSTTCGATSFRTASCRCIVPAPPYMSSLSEELADDPLLSIRAAAGWGDAIVLVPWALYQSYGDTRVLRQNYGAMRAWVDRQIRVAETELPRRLRTSELRRRGEEQAAAALEQRAQLRRLECTEREGRRSVAGAHARRRRDHRRDHRRDVPLSGSRRTLIRGGRARAETTRLRHTVTARPR